MASKWYNSGVSGEEKEESPQITKVEVQTSKKSSGTLAKLAWGILGVFGVKAAAEFVGSAAEFRKAGNPDIILSDEEEE